MRKFFTSIPVVYVAVCTFVIAAFALLTVALSAQAGVFFTDGLRFNVSSQAIADNGAGTAATGTVTVLKSYVELDCQDANGCTVTIGETGAREGQVMVIVVVSANVGNFSDTAGVSELTGAFAAGQYDSLTLCYIGDRWVELARANN